MTNSYYINFTVLKFSFIQRLIVIELFLSESIKKKLSKQQNYFLRKLLPFFLFLFADSKSSQKQPRDDFLKNDC